MWKGLPAYYQSINQSFISSNNPLGFSKDKRLFSRATAHNKTRLLVSKRLTDLLTGVRCRATSVAKNCKVMPYGKKGSSKLSVYKNPFLGNMSIFHFDQISSLKMENSHTN